MVEVYKNVGYKTRMGSVLVGHREGYGYQIGNRQVWGFRKASEAEAALMEALKKAVDGERVSH